MLLHEPEAFLADQLTITGPYRYKLVSQCGRYFRYDTPGEVFSVKESWGAVVTIQDKLGYYTYVPARYLQRA